MFRSPRVLPALLLVAAAACSDLTSPARPGEPARLPVATIDCVAQVAARTVSCGSAPAGGARFDYILGGQNVNVKLTSSNVSYNAGSGLFSFDVTVKNLMVQRMGTADGATIHGVDVFFHAAPTPTGATPGVIEVLNADGSGVFTGANQPYFHYAGVLPYNATSAAKTWQLQVPASVPTFTFSLYVSTPLLPVVLFDAAVGGNRDIYRVGLDGSDLTRITTNAGDDREATAAAGRLVFSSYRDGNAELYLRPLLGATETRLTTNAVSDGDPVLSADGTRLAFTRLVGSPTRVLSGILGDSALTGVAQQSVGSGIEASPSWRPNGEVSYMSTLNGSADLWNGLPGGVQAALVAPPGSNEVEPAWSHDGTRMAFATNRDANNTEIYLYTAATGTQVRLTNRVGSDASPTWLKDGRIVYVCTTASVSRLCRLDPANPGVTDSIPLPSITGSVLRPAAIVF